MLQRIVLAALLLAVSHRVNAIDCTVAHDETEGADDSPAILAAFTECRKDGHIFFEQKNYTAYTPVSLTNLGA